jgi:hypothetical protein
VHNRTLRPCLTPLADREQAPEIAASTCRDVPIFIVERFDRELSLDEENRVDLDMSTCHDCLVFHDQPTLIQKAFEALRQGTAGQLPGHRPKRRR